MKWNKSSLQEKKNITLEKVKTYAKRGTLELRSVAEAVFLTFKDKRTTKRSKIVLLAALVYLLSPIDTIPDLLPGGLLDDMSVLIGALMGASLVGREHHRAARLRFNLTSTGLKDVEPLEKTKATPESPQGDSHVPHPEVPDTTVSSAKVPNDETAKTK